MTLSFVWIIPRGGQLQQKVVNKELKELYTSENTRHIKHSNIHPRNHLYQSKLHFNFHANLLFLNNICKYLECWQVFDCCNFNVKKNSSNEKNDYVDCNHKEIEISSNTLTSFDVSNKNKTENTISKKLEFHFDNDITNKADIYVLMNKNPCKIH